MTDLTVTALSDLSEGQHAAVESLVAAATRADGSPSLSEQFLLDLRPGSGSQHHLAYAGSGLVGYAQVSGEAAELVVAPEARRRGVGTSLLAAVPEEVRVWAHGEVEAASLFAAARGLEVTRELFVLGRSLDGEPALEEAVLPEGLVARTFEPGRDEDEWLRVNAAAFSHHPEQGRMTRADLDQRMTESWFDSAGFILVVPSDDEDAIAAFHWTKVHPAGDKGPDSVGWGHNEGEAKQARVGWGHNEGEAKQARVGEVYVVGVDPAYQGRGLGRPVTLLGIHHLRELGLAEVILYVDGDNPAALKVYRGLGFTTRGLDRMYSRAVHLTVER